jgi:thioredoxin reductase
MGVAARSGGTWDCVIVGGGPAGLSAALILGRCRRRVLVCDAGEPRNAASHALHGFLSRDGVRPAALLAAGRRQLARYDSVVFRRVAVGALTRRGRRFLVATNDGAVEEARYVLLATGVRDRLPPLPGLAEIYGRSAFHCPYCDGWEVRDRPLAVHAPGRSGVGLAVHLKQWSDDVVLCTDGPARLRPAEHDQLRRARVAVEEEAIARLERRGRRLRALVFRSGRRLERSALFLVMPQEQRCLLAARLGCAFTRKGAVDVDHAEMTSVPGLYVAGDSSRDAQLAVIAAAEGARAAMAIHRALMGLR